MDGNGNLSVTQQQQNLNSMNRGKPVLGDPGIPGANMGGRTPLPGRARGGQDRIMADMFKIDKNQYTPPRPIFADSSYNTSSPGNM